jgi:hypothetical protein
MTQVDTFGDKIKNLKTDDTIPLNSSYYNMLLPILEPQDKNKFHDTQFSIRFAAIACILYFLLKHPKSISLLNNLTKSSKNTKLVTYVILIGFLALYYKSY